MPDVEPSAANAYQVAPTITFNRARWNAVMASIAARLAARELLEASFEALIADGTQAALDLIQVNVGPQLETLTQQIAALEEQLEEILGGGRAANSLLLGNQLPAFYLALANATGSLPVAQVSGVEALIQSYIDGLKAGVGTALDTLDELAAALGDDANFAANTAAAIGNRLRFDAAQGLTGPQKTQALSNLGNSHVPTGSVIHVIGNVAPSGFIKLNGALLSRTTYADLWAYAQGSGALVSEATWAISSQGSFGQGDGSTTFRLPDWRGEFARAWDDGRGVDSGRGIGTFQNHAIGPHQHLMPFGWDGSLYYAWYDGSLLPVFGSSVDVGAGRFSFSTGGNTTPGGRFARTGNVEATGGETRPRNVSYLACIKY